MKSHVNGQNTPQGLAKLRRAIYALLGDQLLFSEAEQLQLSLSAHECDDARQLRAELARLRHEIDRRLRVEALQQHARRGRLVASPRTQRRDLHLLCRQVARESGTAGSLFCDLGSLAWHLEVASTRGRRATLVGEAYALLPALHQPSSHLN